MAGRPHRPGDEGGFGLPVGGRSAGVGRGSVRRKGRSIPKGDPARQALKDYKPSRIDKAKTKAKARVSKAKAGLKRAKGQRSQEKKRKAATERTAEKYERSFPLENIRRARRRSKSPESKGLRQDYRDVKSERSSPKIQAAGKRVVSAQKAVKRAQTTASTPIKSRGGGRRTHYLGGHD